MTIIPDDLAEELRDFLTGHALSPQLHARDAEALLNRLEGCMDAAERASIAPSIVATAVCATRDCVYYADHEGGCQARDGSPRTKVDPLAEAFPDEAPRDLARLIMAKTGVMPAVVEKMDDDVPVCSHSALRFSMRDRDGEIATRYLDLREYHQREGVKHALRAAIRIVNLDHCGPPIVGGR